jgi:hypothetical protein
VERLRLKKSFQATKYEIAVAAILTRAGFQIEFLDPSKQTGKHCEFLARHPRHPVAIHVEVKSRVRDGIYHQPGEFHYQGDLKGLLKLVSKARKQGGASPQDPLLIFVDVNVPATPDTPPQEKAWITDMNKVFDRVQNQEPSSDAATWSAVVATNFAMHLGDDEHRSPPVEAGMVWSSSTRAPIPEHLRSAIMNEVLHYGRIPQEV